MSFNVYGTHTIYIYDVEANSDYMLYIWRLFDPFSCICTTRCRLRRHVAYGARPSVVAHGIDVHGLNMGLGCRSRA